MMDTNSDGLPEEWTPDDNLFVLSQTDIEDILSECYVEMREVVGDDDAAVCVEIAHDEITDSYYYEHDG